MQQILADLTQWVQSLHASEFWIGISVITALMIYAFSTMYQSLHRARLLQNIPTSKVRSAAQGYVELKGTAIAIDGEPVYAPLSKKPCLWYDFKIEEKVYESNGKNGVKSRWRIVKQGVSDALFMLEDDTGKCIISPESAHVYASYRKSWNVTGIPPRRYTEKLIFEQEPLYAIGLFKSQHRPSNLDIKKEVSLLLKEWKTQPKALLARFDTDKDGKISIKEWEQARKEAKRIVESQQPVEQSTGTLSILGANIDSSQPFILSTLSESKIIHKFRSGAVLSMCAFFILGIIVIWAMNTRMVW